MAIPTDRVITVDPTSLETSIKLPANFDTFGVLRGGLIILLIFYLILAIMVIKQILMMTKIVKGSGNGFLVMLGYLHFAIVAIMLLFVIFVL